LIRDGKVRRGRLDVTVADLTPVLGPGQNDRSGRAARLRPPAPESYELPRARGHARRIGHVAALPPNYRSQYPPAIHREAGDHVENGEHDIYVTEPGQHRHQRRPRLSQVRQAERPTQRSGQPQTDEADHGAGDRATVGALLKTIRQERHPRIPLPRI